MQQKIRVLEVVAVVANHGEKGTGRARQGSIRAPQWRWGGDVFGPVPRNYAYRIPKKVRY